MSEGAPQLNLKRLETIQRWLQYGALLVLAVFVGLILLSWLQLKHIKTDIDSADAQLQQKKADIIKLTKEAEQLKQEKQGLEDVNGALTTVTRSIGEDSPQQAEKVKQAIEESLTTTVALRVIPPRVYMHISSEEQRPAAVNIARRLQANGYVVPGIANVGDKAPGVADLRYYQDDDATMKEVADIKTKCEGWGLKLNVPSKPVVSRTARPRHYEIWFGKVGRPPIDVTHGFNPNLRGRQIINPN